MPRSSKFNEPITIEEPTFSRDVTGNKRAKESWSNFASPFAEVRRSVTATEESAEDEMMEEGRMVEFAIRYRSGVTTEMRIDWDGDKYDIKSVGDETGMKEELTIEAKLTEPH